DAHEGHLALHFHGHPAWEEWHAGLVSFPPPERAGRAAHTALFPQSANSSEPHGGTPMQEHVLEVGEELVMEGGICLTLLAAEAGEVRLGVAACDPSDVAGPEAGYGPWSSTQAAHRTAHKPTV